MTTRRSILTAAVGTLGLSTLAPGVWASAPRLETLDAIRAETGGRLGVMALDTGNGRRLMIDPSSRYALCSTFKLPLVAAVLAGVDAGRIALDTPVRFTAADLLDYAPAVKANLAAGQMTIGALCEAAITLSDNSAVNLLYPQVGGPARLTRWVRAVGDPVTRFDRTEPALNNVAPGDLRDTTTPAAMVELMRGLLVGDVLSAPSRARLLGWLAASRTGAAMLRAGLPADWKAGDKTGRSGTGAVNDVAIVFPPGRKPILVASYLDVPGIAAEAANAAHARVAVLVSAVFAQA